MPSDTPSQPDFSFTVCRDGEPVPAGLEGAMAAIGNFDGVHRGHRHLLDMALESGRPGAVISRRHTGSILAASRTRLSSRIS